MLKLKTSFMCLAMFAIIQCPGGAEAGNGLRQGDHATTLTATTVNAAKPTAAKTNVAKPDQESNDVFVQPESSKPVDKETVNTYRRVNITIGALLVISIAILVNLLVLYRKNQRLNSRLTKLNKTLIRERNNLRNAQADLIRARNKALSAENRKTQLVNYVSHEIVTPLNTIVQYSHMIIEAIDEEKRDYLENFADVVRINTKMLQTLANDVQEINALECNELPLNIVPASVLKICNTALDSVKPEIKNEKVKLIFPQAESDDHTINTDPLRVETMLINLLSNAVKFTDEGTVELSYEVNRSNHTITFSVTDTGPGIPQGKDDEIFERFSKLNPETEGHGLGLPICKLVAQLLETDVMLDRSHQNGARFHFTLPMDTSKKDVAQVQPQEVEATIS
jgi:signal transduction histidine kinase